MEKVRVISKKNKDRRIKELKKIIVDIRNNPKEYKEVRKILVN